MRLGRNEGMLEDNTYNNRRKKPSSNEEMKYLLEVNGCCPICGKYLIKDKNGRSNKLFQIAHIYPNSPLPNEKIELKGLERLGTNSEDFENKIALCKDCHGYYDDHKTKEEYLRILNIKKDLLHSNKASKILTKQPIEEELNIVITKLINMGGNIIELEMNALKISNKIEDTNLLLKNKVEMYVTHYFRYIQEQFKNLSIQEKLDFEVLASQVRTAFLQAKKELENKNEIFNHLSLWLKSKTQTASIEACEAIISYFIQNCEVFHEITK